MPFRRPNTSAYRPAQEVFGKEQERRQVAEIDAGRTRLTASESAILRVWRPLWSMRDVTTRLGGGSTSPHSRCWPCRSQVRLAQRRTGSAAYVAGTCKATFTLSKELSAIGRRRVPWASTMVNISSFTPP